jgi:hypothetical protein
MNTTKTIITGVVVILIATIIISLVHYILPEGWTTFFSYLKDNVLISRWIWWLSIIVNILFALGTIIFLIIVYRSKTDESVKYTHDTFFGICWRWRYGIDGIYNLCSFCPDCDIQIYASPKTPPPTQLPRGVMIHPVYPPSESIIYQCNECEWDGKEFDISESKIKDRVTLKIQQKLRSKS